jgi:zinc and cadmium transporter
MTFFLLLLCSLAGSAGSALLASLLLLRRSEFPPRVKTALLSYATGTMLGAALLGMIPHALEHLSVRTGLGTVLAGIVGFFVLEKLLLWRHCHEPGCPAHSQAGSLILLGDAGHNLLDGVAIALAFRQSIALGLATTVAVVAHEIPQEIGDITILLHSGYSKFKAVFANTLASLTTFVGALGAWWAGEKAAALAPYAMAISAASFLYIALADLTPDHRTQTRLRDTLIQLSGIAAGIATIALIHRTQH